MPAILNQKEGLVAAVSNLPKHILTAYSGHKWAQKRLTISLCPFQYKSVTMHTWIVLLVSSSQKLQDLFSLSPNPHCSPHQQILDKNLLLSRCTNVFPKAGMERTAAQWGCSHRNTKHKNITWYRDNRHICILVSPTSRIQEKSTSIM